MTESFTALISVTGECPKASQSSIVALSPIVVPMRCYAGWVFDSLMMEATTSVLRWIGFRWRSSLSCRTGSRRGWCSVPLGWFGRIRVWPLRDEKRYSIHGL